MKCLVGLWVFLILFSACSKKQQAYAPRYNFSNKINIPDYNRLDYWAAHPWKQDPSDSVPAPLLNEQRDSVADVFFIYPTIYTGPRDGWNADINDPELNSKIDYSTILYQASVFNQHCRIFSPRYRQAHLSAFFIDSLESKPYFDTAYADIKRAFEFYLQNFHHNRPLFIAGHSQGAKLAERLLKEFFDGKPLQKDLVAAYIVGWPIPNGIFETIPVCSDSNQTGCCCGWRTLKKNYMPKYVQKEAQLSLVTNPLSWDTSNSYVSATNNRGSVLKDFNRLIPHTTDAQIYKGVLWVNRPNFPGSLLYRSKNYHIADINLYYMNMRSNIASRLKNFRQNDHASY
ncbi:MAG: DUF3089 domain-containing protein [Flavisolibacter sp.]